MRNTIQFGAILASLLIPLTVWGHGEENHDDPGVSIEVDSAIDKNPLPLDITGEFDLVDYTGQSVTEKDYSGKHMLVFFGYANCKNMCSISLSRIGKAMEQLGDSIEGIAPLIITVDPERDTPETLKSELAKYHPSLIGLTGTPEQLNTVYDNFNQEPITAGEDWNNDLIISHSSYIYLLDQNGGLATLFPPILNPESMADIILKYLGQAS